MAHHYIAQFLPQEDGTFCVFFPDLEGCNTFGDTLQEAFEAAQDAATGWLGWSLDFVFPCVCATGLVMEIALWGILKTPVHVVAGPVGGLGLAGLVPGVLVLVGLVGFALPSLLCTALSILFLAGLVLLRRRTAWGELRRRFHV